MHHALALLQLVADITDGGSQYSLVARTQEARQVELRHQVLTGFYLLAQVGIHHVLRVSHTHKVPTRQALGQGEGNAHLSVLVRTKLRIEEGRLIEVLAHRHSDGLLRFGLCAFFVIRLQCDLTQYGAIR